MGGLVWSWGKARSFARRENFQKGLVALQEADLNIKRSRLAPQQALEVLVVKGKAKQVRKLADNIRAVKGVKSGELVVTKTYF